MKAPIWDLPTRLFHWLLVALIALSWWSAEYHQDELHIWLGMAVLSLLIFRLLWGFVGGSTARFANFIRGPRAVFGYLRGGWRGIGHNPLGALSVVALLAMAGIQVVLGLFILYQLYRMTFAPSPMLAGLTVFDLVVVWLIWHEYRVRKLGSDGSAAT